MVVSFICGGNQSTQRKPRPAVSHEEGQSIQWPKENGQLKVELHEPIRKPG